DEDMTDQELKTMGMLVHTLPAFEGFDPEDLPTVAATCGDILAEESEDGLERVLDLIHDSLPAHLRETAYAVSCEVAVSDGFLEQEELRLLEMMRHKLDISRLTAAAIEAGTRARYARA
ncbi:MAG: tellurite resistance TerB family protein, partial [Rhodospirillaceae bacterium]